MAEETDGSHAGELARAAEAVARAEAILIGAGAGMGVDAGLPDFRGREGFWKAYPPFARLGLDFYALADPRWFASDPALAWGFYGHRLGLYRSTPPHDGYAILNRWATAMPRGGFVFTSNVDGHFRRAGFDPEAIHEVHGSFEWMQCTAGCGVGLFPGEGIAVRVDPETMRAEPPLPSCPGCGSLARPNILMFRDGHWDPSASDRQEARLARWLGSLAGARTVVVECGAGTAVPTVRRTCEAAASRLGATLVRINVREPQAPPCHVSIAMPALKALAAIDHMLDGAPT